MLVTGFFRRIATDAGAQTPTPTGGNSLGNEEGETSRIFTVQLLGQTVGQSNDSDTREPSRKPCNIKSFGKKGKLVKVAPTFRPSPPAFGRPAAMQAVFVCRRQEPG